MRIAEAGATTPAIQRYSPATFLLVAAAAALGAGIAGLWLTSGNALVQSPYHHDDFELLATSVRALPPLIRPVSDFAIAVLADLGAPVFYGVLLVLILLYAPLCTLFTARFLELDRPPAQLAAVGFAVGLGTFLFEASCEAYRWTGFITNAMSTSFGAAAALLALRAAERGVGAKLGALGLFALAVFAKEDCGPFVLLATAVAFGRALRGGQRRAAWSAGSLLVALTAIALAAIAYGRLVVDSPFTGGVGVYQTSFSPAAMARVALQYLTITPGAIVILAGYAFATAAVLVVCPGVAGRFLWTWALVAALLLPYAPLARHVYPIYAYNWLPEMLAAAVLGWVECARARRERVARAGFAALAAVMAVGLVFVSKVGREVAATDITVRQANNRTILHELARHREALRRHGEVVVEGLDALQTPWWFNRAEYVNRELGADVRWLFVAAPTSSVARAYRDFDRPIDNGSVAIVTPACAQQLRGIPRLRFATDLRAALVEDDGANIEPAAGELALGEEDPTGRTCRGWSAPESLGDARLRWAEGPQANLVLALPQGRDLRLVLRARAAADLRADPQWMAVSVDGKRARVARVPREPSEIAVEVPAALVRAPTSLVTFEFADWRYHDAPLPPDGRRDAAGFESIAVE